MPVEVSIVVGAVVFLLGVALFFAPSAGLVVGNLVALVVDRAAGDEFRARLLVAVVGFLVLVAAVGAVGSDLDDRLAALGAFVIAGILLERGLGVGDPPVPLFGSALLGLLLLVVVAHSCPPRILAAL